MNERQIIESTIDNLRFAEANCHRVPEGDIPTMLAASAEVRHALEQFSGSRSDAPAESGGIPEARANFIASRAAAEHLLARAGHDLDVLANIEAATREMRNGFPA